MKLTDGGELKIVIFTVRICTMHQAHVKRFLKVERTHRNMGGDGGGGRIVEIFAFIFARNLPHSVCVYTCATELIRHVSWVYEK